MRVGPRATGSAHADSKSMPSGLGRPHLAWKRRRKSHSSHSIGASGQLISGPPADGDQLAIKRWNSPSGVRRRSGSSCPATSSRLSLMHLRRQSPRNIQANSSALSSLHSPSPHPRCTPLYYLAQGRLLMCFCNTISPEPPRTKGSQSACAARRLEFNCNRHRRHPVLL